MNRNKNIVFGMLALVVSVVAIGLAYAGFTGTLNINGTGNVISAKWDIYFNNLSNAVTTGTANVVTPATISPKTKIGDYYVELASPGDSVTYTFDVVNDGSFDAVLTTLTKSSPTCSGGATLCSYLTYTLKYTSNNRDVAENDKLLVGETKNMTLKLTLNPNMPASALSSTEVSVSNLGITLLYSQNSSFGGNPVEPAVTYITRQNEGTITKEDEVAIGEEHFYVVSSDSTNTVLLSKYDLKSDGNGSYMQDTSGTYTNTVKVKFLGSNNTAYWDNANCAYNGSWSCPGTEGLKSTYANSANAAGATSYTSPYPEVYDSNAVSIYRVVNSYVNKIASAAGITLSGKLMTYEQASSLSADVRKDMNGTYYWLGSADSQNSLWRVFYSGGSIRTCYGNLNYGVRPVIIVSTSEIPN